MEKPQQRVSSNQASPNTTRKYTAQETIEIYTDWANHYLEKARSKKRIHDLQTDISDGVVLCDIIEAVTNQKIPDINRKPKTSSQMLENVSVCLSLLESLGVATEGVTARDVREGSLKSILGLFFALSRFKQRQRRELQQKQLQEAIMPRLPSPFNKHGATSIPVPASVAARRGATPIGKCGGASRPSSPGIGSGNGLVNCSGGGGGVVTSLIPTPRSASRTDKPINQIKSATGTGARSLRPPSYTSSGSTNVMLNHSGSGQSTLERGMKHPQNVVHSNPNVPSSGVATTTSNSTTPSSVLDKFKFFNSPPRSTKQGPVGSKRTSSSSGFSSARSERSDSSASINSDARLPQGYVLPMSPPSPQDSSRNQHKNKTTKVHVNSPRNSRKTTKKTPSYSNLSTESDLQNSRDSSNSRYVESLSPKTDMKSNHRSKMNIESSSSIPKPTAAVKGTSKVMPDKIKSTNNGAADSYLRKPLKDSVAMVCPMPLISESTSPAAVSSPSGVQVAMFAKGVRPGETPSPTQAPPSSTQQQCVGVTVVGASSDTLHLREFDLHQQQPQHQPTNILADKGVPSETLQVTADTVNASTIDDEEAGMRVKPMQPLSYVRPGIFNGDRQRTCFMPEILRLSRRNGTFLSGSHFADLDMAAGYLSDGEVLRGGGSSGSLLEPADGYLSEGAASLYMRRAMRDSLEDDSSSLSSEVSEPLNELSEERHLEKKRLPDNNICETQINGYTNSPGGPGGELDSSGPHQHHHHHQQQQQQQQGLRPVLKVVSSRQLVKKADSSQQTESSAFRQGNHWKRYPIPEGGNGGSSGGSGKPSLESRPELRRGKSDLGEQREKSREKNRDRVDKLQQERAAAVVNGGGSSRSHQGERSRRSQGAKDEERRSSSRGSQGGSSSKGSGGGVTLQQQSSGSEASSPGSSRPRGGGNGNNSHHVRVPASFGYVSKRANSNVSVCSNRSHTSSSANGKANDDLSRTAQVSAVPRNSESNTNSGQRPRHSKVKISGGTQTTSSDINPSPVEYNTTPSPSRRGSSSSYKSYSLTAPTASQLSANVRERLLLVGGNSHSLPKASNAGNTSLPNEYAHALFASSPRTGPRAGARFTDGSLSDTTGYSNYSELTGNTGGNSGNGYYGVPGVGSPYSWLRHSSTYNASIATARCNAANSSLTESTDSLSSLGSQHRTSLSHARILMHPRDGSPGPRLNRSNSIRSTKSEKLYPSMLQRSEDLLLDSYYNSVLSASTTGPSQTMHRPAPDSQASQPTSPTPSQGNNRSASSHGLSRPTTMSPYLISSKISCKDDEMHGSSLSLVSTASSLYSTAEEKQAHEIRKLRRELMEAQDKVHTLTNQLSTNAHVVSAFEQSLSNMTQRLQQLTASAEKKDSELLELRHTIDMLRQHSMDAGLTQLQQGSNMARQLSTDSVSSLSSACSGASHVSGRRGIPGGTSSKKKKGWLRSSFSKAFSRTKKSRHGSLSLSDVEDGRTPGSELSAPSSPMLQSHKHHSLALASAQLNNDALKLSHSSSAIYGQEIEGNGPEVVHELRKQLREKDLVLTDIRLEALSSAHQLESLKDTVLKMRNEMMSLKQDNERLQRIVTSKSLTSSQSSLPITDSLERRFSMSDTPALATLECTTVHGDPDGRLVGVAVLLGGKHVCGAANVHELGEDGAEWRVANIGVGGKMQWEALDALVRRVFKEYVLRVDPVSNLGLSADSVYAYHVGEITRVLSEGLPKTPELLPYGYLIGEEISIKICIKTAQHSGSVDAMAFETLIPKSIVQRYVSLLSEHRRIILCGPSGTGKSFLANKLAQYLVLRDNREPTPEVIATFNVDHKSSKELRQYLANIAEQCENNASDLPSVIILDNLHNAGSLGEIFNGFLNTKYTKCPYIIGTMNQATCSTTNLQLHHNFRWVLCANHMEPVKGFLARFLKRRLMETEIKNIQRNPELARIFEWIPKVWNHLNKFLETHSSSDVTIGPRLFLSCPAELAGSQVWFTDLWNYSVVPYLLEAVREGLQLYGRRGAWEDPTRFITQTYPWSAEAVHGGADALIRLRPEDVGYDIQATLASASTSPPGPGGNLQAHAAPNTDNEGDPLLNMLMRLQEAANYSSPHDGMDSSDSANSGERDSRETDREGEQDVEDHEGE